MSVAGEGLTEPNLASAKRKANESLLACHFQQVNMVGVVQLAEHRIVVPGVVGSSPITHPIKKDRPLGLSFLYWYLVGNGARKAD